MGSVIKEHKDDLQFMKGTERGKMMNNIVSQLVIAGILAGIVLSGYPIFGKILNPITLPVNGRKGRTSGRLRRR